jgi:hypothetical protein
MTEDEDFLSWLALLTRRDIETARKKYVERFGRLDDPIIEDALHEVLRSHDFHESGDRVIVPAKLVLAIVLRPRGRTGGGRGRPRKAQRAYDHARDARRAVSAASKMWGELYYRDRVASKTAKDRAANAVLPIYGTQAISMKSLKKQMRRLRPR